MAAIKRLRFGHRERITRIGRTHLLYMEITSFLVLSAITSHILPQVSIEGELGL